MLSFQLTALLLTVLWLLLVVIWFRRSTLVLLLGLFALGVYTLVSLALGRVSPADLGLNVPQSWQLTIGLALAGLGVMIACSPLADRLASRWFPKPPTLAAFGGLQQSRAKLIAGIAAAWLLGGFLEELVARGIVLQAVAALLTAWLGPLPAAGVAIIIAAAGAGLMHLYQGPRAVLIIAQLSLLFGLVFVLGRYNLWAVILCHGLYDTIAFIRFANKQSKYSTDY